IENGLCYCCAKLKVRASFSATVAKPRAVSGQVKTSKMREEEIPDYNIFMMCEQLNENALTELNTDYYFRNCRPNELEIWKAFPFDSETVPDEYEDFMNQLI